MYVKQFDKEGNLLNPITKENPFINTNVKQKKAKNRLKSKMIFSKVGNSFYKYQVRLQHIGNKTIEHYILLN